MIYQNEEAFKLGKSKVVVQSENDSLLVIAGGITLHESMKACEKLKKEGINIRVLDLFSVKPIDQSGILQNAIESNSTVLTVEDMDELNVCFFSIFLVFIIKFLEFTAISMNFPLNFQIFPTLIFFNFYR